MPSVHYVPRNTTLPLTITTETFGIAVTICHDRHVRFVPIEHCLAVNGPFTINHRTAERAAKTLIRVAQHLALAHPDTARDLVTFAATLLVSGGGTFRAT